MNNNKCFSIKIGDFQVANNLPLTVIAGPCVIESNEHANFMAESIHKITKKLGVNFIFKSSFDKANRTSLGSSRGVGMEKGLQILADIKDKYNIPVITDVHESYQCKPVSEVVDILQIPAFLCRQTDLILAAAATNKVVNIKKGQFLSPNDMLNVAEKFISSGNSQLLLCERGTTFGYNNLIVDITAIPILASSGYPVVFDATHSVQLPGGLGGKTGGRREMVEYLSKAAVAVGISTLFLEVHDDPDNAPSDGPNMWRLSELENLLSTLQKLDGLVKGY